MVPDQGGLAGLADDERTLGRTAGRPAQLGHEQAGVVTGALELADRLGELVDHEVRGGCVGVDGEPVEAVPAPAAYMPWRNGTSFSPSSLSLSPALTIVAPGSAVLIAAEAACRSAVYAAGFGPAGQ